MKRGMKIRKVKKNQAFCPKSGMSLFGWKSQSTVFNHLKLVLSNIIFFICWVFFLSIDGKKYDSRCRIYSIDPYGVHIVWFITFRQFFISPNKFGLEKDFDTKKDLQKDWAVSQSGTYQKGGWISTRGTGVIQKREAIILKVVQSLK